MTDDDVGELVRLRSMEARLVAFLADAERIYRDAGFVVPGVAENAALVSTNGVREVMAGTVGS